MSHITVITGSPTERSRVNGVITFAKVELLKRGHTLSWINVRDLPPEDLVYAKIESEYIYKANQEVEKADAVIVATPVYKAAYTGLLKSYLDLLPQNAFKDKRLLPVAVGGTVSHLLMIEYALKPVLSALGARHIVGSVYAVDADVTVGDDYNYRLSDDLRERLTRNLQLLV